MPELPTTQWSLIRASAGGDTHAAKAWEALVADYEKAIRAFFRRSPLRTDADDLTELIMEASIAGGWWGRADEGKGSFRSFLFLLLRRFLAKQLRDAPPRTEEIDVDHADHSPKHPDHGRPSTAAALDPVAAGASPRVVRQPSAVRCGNAVHPGGPAQQ